MATVVVMNDENRSLDSVLKASSAASSLGASGRSKSVSCMTEVTCEADASSLTDDEDGAASPTADRSSIVKDIINEEDQTEVSMDSSSGRAETCSTPEPSGHEERKEEDSAANASPSSRPTSQQSPSRRRQSILKPCDMEIPVKNRGWKNLPKLARTSSTPVVASRRASAPELQRRVNFATVNIRCYEQCIGDNPAVSYGTPISLDWTYDEMDPLELDSYEATRGKRRNPRQMMMNYFNRRHVLTHSVGATEEELVLAEKAANKIRNQRSLTRALLPASFMEDLVSSAARKTKRAMKGSAKKTMDETPAHHRVSL